MSIGQKTCTEKNRRRKISSQLNDLCRRDVHHRKLGVEMLEDRRLLSIDSPQIELFNVSPALFVENQGQLADESVRFVHQGDGANVAMTDAGPVFQVFRTLSNTDTSSAGTIPELLDGLPNNLQPDNSTTEILQFSASFVGANVVTPVGIDPSETKFNYFIGEQSNWHSEVPSYQTVAYDNLYAGINLKTWGQRSHLKYEFHVAPGADYRQIQVRYSGIEGLSLAADGSLQVNLGGDWGMLTDDVPYIYQIIDGQQVEVAGKFDLIDSQTYYFTITGDYDHAQELVIDPDLSWASYLGGSGYEYGNSIAVDAAGNALLTGRTYSTNFPTPNGFDTSLGGPYDAFVAKVTSTGQLAWASYLGGSSSDYGCGIAVDAAGNALLIGGTYSTNFPTPNGFDTSLGGSYDAFVAKVTSTGQLAWASYLGGSSGDWGSGIAVDAAGNALLTGYTGSTNFPTPNGFDTIFNGGSYDAFVAKVTSTGQLAWASYLGGSNNDEGYGIAVDAAGYALLTGRTYSTNFPTPNGFDTILGGSYDAFVANVTSTGQLAWASYLGGSSDDFGWGIAVDAAGNALLTGYTGSTNFPTPNGFDTIFNGLYDAFVAKVTSTGQLAWASYLGGSNNDEGYGIAVDAAGNALLTGYTGSTNFPTPNGFDTSYNGGSYDAFVAKVTSTGQLAWASYLGGSNNDCGNSIAVDAAGNALLTGGTYSTNFPTPNGFDTIFNGGSYDAFVAKVTYHRAIQDSDLNQVRNEIDAHLITGATIITHGFQTSNAGGDSLLSLAQAINQKAGGWLIDDDISGNAGTSDFFVGSKVTGTGKGNEVVLLFDWAPESNEDSAGWGEAAGDALFSIIVDLGLVYPELGILNSIPLHFIGHSFGAAVTSEVVERLAKYNVPVDQITYLDPHDFDQSFLPIDGNQELWTLGEPDNYGVTVWNNVVFCDAYYETRGSNAGSLMPDFVVPQGRPIPGAYNVFLDDELPDITLDPYPVGFAGASGDHSYVWEYYYMATVTGILPSYPLNPLVPFDVHSTGYAFSRNANECTRPSPNFYGGIQDHKNSDASVVNTTTGEPNLTGLAALGFINPDTAAYEFTNYKWSPQWNPITIYNGNFQYPGDNSLVGGYTLPGWTDHGGGGTAHIEGSLSDYYLQLDAGDVNRTHNWWYVPEDAAKLKFSLDINVPKSNTFLNVYLDSYAILSNYSLSVGTSGFTTITCDIPPAIPDGVYTMKFEITDGGLTGTPQINIDDVCLMTRPKDIFLSYNAVYENRVAGTTVGILSSIDRDSTWPCTYSLVAGAADNNYFQIAGTELRTTVVFNYESRSSYSIILRATDYDGLTYDEMMTITVTDQPEVFTATAGDWITSGLTLSLGGDGKLHLYQNGTTTDAVPPHNPASVTGVSITGRDNTDIVNNNYSGIYSSLLVKNATFKINEDNAISAGTDVTIDGGVLDLNGKTDTIDDLLLKSGSVINGTLHADSYNIESGTVTAAISGPGSLQKTTTAQATTGIVNTSNVTVDAGQLTATSINTGTLTIEAGATLTIAPIAGGPLAAYSALTPLATLALRPTALKPIAQPTAANTIVPSSSTATAISAGPLAASTVLAAPIATNSEVVSAIATTTGTIADTTLPVRLPEHTPARLIDTAINRLLPQSPIYSRLDSTVLHPIIESGLEQSLTTRNGNITSTPILGPLRDELSSRVSKYEKHPTTLIINSRQAHFAALQTVVQNSRWTDTDAEVDFDIAQHVRAGKHTKQLEKAVDEVLAEEEDAIPALL